MIPPHCLWPPVLSSHHQTSSSAIYKAWRHRLISVVTIVQMGGSGSGVRVSMACPGGCQEGPTVMGKRATGKLTGDFRVQLRFGRIWAGARKVVGWPGNPPDNTPLPAIPPPNG